MSQTTPPPGADATPDEIEADIAATRARLTESVDALADKVNVKARAQDKVADVKSSAKDKLAEVKANAAEKVAGVKATVQDKVGGSHGGSASTGGAAPSRAAAPVGTREKVTAGSQQVLARVQGLPRSAQLGLIGASTLLLMVLLTRPKRA